MGLSSMGPSRPISFMKRVQNEQWEMSFRPRDVRGGGLGKSNLGNNNYPLSFLKLCEANLRTLNAIKLDTSQTIILSLSV